MIEKCFFDFYLKRGATVPPKMTDDHKTLVAALNNLLNVSRTMLDLVVLRSNDNGTKLESTVAELKTSYETFYEHMDAHLNEEETYWPSEIAKHGEVSFSTFQPPLLSLFYFMLFYVFSFYLFRKYILNVNQN
jgi:hypothetical protein